MREPCIPFAPMAHKDVQRIDPLELVLGTAVLFGFILVIVVWLGIYP